MGLDIWLEKKTDYEREDYSETTELAYGRKTWAIHDYFYKHPTCKPIEADIVVEISEEAYDELCDRLENFKPYLELISKADEKNSKIDEYMSEYIFYEVFDYDAYPQLGFQWECVALYRWVFENRDKIKQAFKEDKVYMLASY